jgi:site-specific recombinase XerD
MTEVDRFLEYLVERDYDPETVSNYRSTLKQFGAWFEKTTGQPFTAANVTPLDVRQYRDDCKTRSRPATVNGHLIRLNVFFRWAVETGLVVANPLGKIKRLNNPDTPPKWLTRQETYRLLRTAQQQVQLAQVKRLDYSIRIATRTLAMLVLL